MEDDEALVAALEAQPVETTPTLAPKSDIDLISIATSNIQRGRNGCLETALRALDIMGLDLALLKETKLTNGIHTKYSSDYNNLLATSAASHRQGGVALVHKDLPYWQVESVVYHHSNVISAEIVMGEQRCLLVGIYIPPDDLTTLEHVERTLHLYQHQGDLIVVGDLSVNLSTAEGMRDIAIATVLAVHGLLDMHQHF